MSTASDLAATLKIELNSVLVSGGREINLRQLEVDYFDLNRKPIPYREAGYTNVEDLVQSIPDAVSCRWVNGELRVRGVTNERNGHVARLVGLNKNKPKSSYRRMQRTDNVPHCPPRFMPANGSSDGPMRSRANGAVCMSTSSPSICTPANGPACAPMDGPSIRTPANGPSCTSTGGPSIRTPANGPACAPGEGSSMHDQRFRILRGQILDLMLSYRSGLKGSQFVEAFAKRYGNYRLIADSGYENIAKLLEAMPDVVEVRYAGNMEDFVVHGKLESKRSRDHQTTPSFHKESSPNVKTTPNAISNGAPLNPYESFLDDDDVDLEEQMLNDGDFGTPLNLEELKTKVQQVLSLHPKGLFCSKFLKEFQRVTGQEIKLKKFDCVTVTDLMSWMPDTVVLERPSSGDWILFDKRTFRKELLEQNHSRGCFPPTPTFSDFQACLRIVLEKYRDGVLLSELEMVYENNVQQSINAKHLGFANLDKLLEAVDGMVEVKYLGEGRVSLKLSKTASEVFDKVPSKKDSSLKPFANFMDASIPKGAVPYPYVYRDQDPPRPSRKYVEVVVSEVKNPSHFWFHLAAAKLSLNELMDDLQQFYKSRSSEAYVIPSRMLKAGLCCVALYPENAEWHRCIVSDVTNECIKVFYVDYGTEGTVLKSSLRLITWDFLTAIPKQALRGRLSKIEPANKTWTPEAINRFFNMVVDRQLIALVTEYTEENGGCCSLCLCDTTGSEDIHINDHLFYEGHAVLVEQEFKVDEDGDVDSDDIVFDSDVDDCGFEENDGGKEVVGDAETTKSALNVNAKPFMPCGAYCQTDNRMKDSNSTTQQHLFKFVQLTPRHSMHLLNIEEKPYVISTEVSLFFWEEDDLIRTMLRNRGKANLPKLVLTMDEHSDLIKQLVESKLPGTTVDGEPREILVLYELSSVITILEMFNHESEELKIAVQQQFDLFNPHDPCWTGKNEVDDLEKFKEQETVKIWNEYRKKRENYLSQLLQTKTATPSQMASLITQLEETEAELAKLRENFGHIAELESTSAESSRSTGSNHGVVSVGDVILQQGQSYLKRNGTEALNRSKDKDVNSNVALTSMNANAVVSASPVACAVPQPVSSDVSSNNHPVNTLASSMQMISLNNSWVPPPFGIGGANTPFDNVPGYSVVSPFNQLPNNTALVRPLAYDTSGLLNPQTGFYPAPGLLPSLSALNYQYLYQLGPFL